MMNFMKKILAALVLLAAAAMGQQREAVPVREVNVHIVARHADGKIFSEQWVHNLTTTGGLDWLAAEMGGAHPAIASYIALSNNATAPAVGDCAAGSSSCTLSGEITGNGLARAPGTYAHTIGTNTWTLVYTWTATGTQSVQEAGMFNAASSGTMVFETQFSSQVNMISGDTLILTWTVTV